MELRPFTTSPFSVPSGDYLSALGSRWFGRYWLVIAVPVLIMLTVGAVWDSRWLFVALIVGFIIVPMILSGLYYHYMLTPEMGRAVLRRSVICHPDGSLTVSYHPALHKVKVTLPDGTVEDRMEEKDDSVPLPPSETIPASAIRTVSAKDRYLELMLHGDRLQIILIPHSNITYQ